MDSEKYDRMRSKLEAAGLLTPTTGEPMEVNYPPEGAKDWDYLPPRKNTPPAMDMKVFGQKSTMARMALRIFTMSENMWHDTPNEAIKILEDASERMADLALRYRG